MPWSNCAQSVGWLTITEAEKHWSNLGKSPICHFYPISLFQSRLVFSNPVAFQTLNKNEFIVGKGRCTTGWHGTFTPREYMDITLVTASANCLLQTWVIIIGLSLFIWDQLDPYGEAGYLHQPVAQTDCSYNQGN
jgi:hypothetical protein